mmetsp:Transcript_11064/g.18512  ORF Transcript_11064/g.18512 Transcript_11064/m.18512 type:complete len:95 (+) Transcript_11064:397-681(+)
MRDYYSPEGQVLKREEKQEKWREFNKFVLALLQLYLRGSDIDNAQLSQVFLMNLKEIACENSLGSEMTVVDSKKKDDGEEEEDIGSKDEMNVLI